MGETSIKYSSSSNITSSESILNSDSLFIEVFVRNLLPYITNCDRLKFIKTFFILNSSEELKIS